MAHETILHQDVLRLLLLLLLLVHVVVFLIHAYGPVAASLMLLLGQRTLDLALPGCFTPAPHKGILHDAAEASVVASSGGPSDTTFLRAAH